MTVRVVKADGRVEKFLPQKVRRTLRKAGVSSRTAMKIVAKIQETIYDGITTKEILKRVKSLIPEEEPNAGLRYGLKGAIMRLGPTGFPFETFVSEVFENYGYRTRLRSKLKGRCVQHEIDVIAEREEGRVVRSMMECKFHNVSGGSIDLKDVLYTYARFLDMNDGSYAAKGNKFDKVWLVSNTKASPDATKYANCRGMKLLCWRYPKGAGLEKMIEDKRLYPVTILPSVDRQTLDKLFLANSLLVKDLLIDDLSNINKTGLKTKKLEKLTSEAKQLILQ